MGQSKLVISETDTRSREQSLVKNTQRHSFDPRKNSGFRSVFPNPVAARNRNRPKTDSR